MDLTGVSGYQPRGQKEGTMPMRFKKIIAGVMCAVLGITLCGCGNTGEVSDSGTSGAISESSVPESEPQPVLSEYKAASLSSDGTLDITRKEIGNTPMGEDGTWTIFVYMSGSNLESSVGKATEDIDEMLAASTGKNVRFIVQTGGSESWRNDYASKDTLGRFEISDGELKTIEKLPLASMASSSTLRDFLKWGVQKYPAAKMGVVFWGHGKGSIVGVCKDDLFKDSYLSLAGIQNALDEVTSGMTDKFEFVGFDACYMGSAEAADILAAYSRYMIGSEELEPLNGWNYTVLGDLLGRDPNADWHTIAKTLCDGFYDGIGDTEYANRVTISAVDLTKIDEVIVKFNALAGDLCEVLTDRTKLGEFEKTLKNAEHFSNENGFWGYANTADLADLARAGGQFSDKADEVIKAIDKAIVYKRNAVEHQNACGLTVCYPFEPNGLAKMRTFAELSISPYYLALADIVLKSGSPIADLSDYDKSAIAGLWCGSKNGNPQELRNYWSSAPDPGLNRDDSGKSTLVKFAGVLVEENIGEISLDIEHNGTYSIALDPETLTDIASVGISVFSSQPQHRYNGLGVMPCANADWQTGDFSDSFDGRWYMLPNGEPLQIKLRENTGGVNVYDAQIKLSGRETTLTFSHGADGDPAINGVRRIGENGISAFEPLADGDTVSAFYDVYSHLNDKFSSDDGTEYTVGGATAVLYEKLPDGDYYYMVVITDILGDKLQSEIVDFSVTNGQPAFGENN